MLLPLLVVVVVVVVVVAGGGFQSFSRWSSCKSKVVLNTFSLFCGVSTWAASTAWAFPGGCGPMQAGPSLDAVLEIFLGICGNDGAGIFQVPSTRSTRWSVLWCCPQHPSDPSLLWEVKGVNREMIRQLN